MIDKNEILPVLRSVFSDEVTSLYPVNKGVMTFKFEFRYHNEDYIIRIYPDSRREIAALEKEYYSILNEYQVKKPQYITSSLEINDTKNSFIIYKKLEGSTLREIFSKLQKKQKLKLIYQVKENYDRISGIETKGAGNITGSLNCSHSSWKSFLIEVLNESSSYMEDAESLKGIDSGGLLERLSTEVSSFVPESNSFTWSDFSQDNIIVSEKGELMGFIDFESMMGADSLFGTGCLYAQDGNTEFCRLYCSISVNKGEDRNIKIYSIIRYLRLLPYLHQPLPNGDPRDPINEFLPKAYEIIKQYLTR